MTFFKLARRTALVALPVLALATALPAQAAYPEKPIRLVLPFGAGGVADVTARILADKLGEKFGQRVVVENMPGPGGIAAARAVISAPADGYTMLYVTNGTAISVASFNNLPFDPVKDLSMVSLVGTFDLVLVVNPDSKYKTLEDFLKDARANPGKLNIGSIAVGSTQNLGAELFKSVTGLNVQIVPYKNSSDIVVALLRNDVSMMVDFPPAVQGQVNDRKLKILATSATTKSPLSPEIPPAADVGAKGYEVLSWNAVGMPKGTPKDIVDRMNKAIGEVMAMPEVKDAYAKVGVVAKSSTPDELFKRLTADIKKWDDVIVKAGIPKK